MRGEKIQAQKKPVRGTLRIKQKTARKTLVSDEDKIKREAKRRDFHRCRWPHQTLEEAARCVMLRVESAHLTHKGMGGDKQLIRTKRELLITQGVQCHDLLDGRVIGGIPRRIRFLTDKQADGPCAFDVKRGKKWVEVGREVSVGVLERR